MPRCLKRSALNVQVRRAISADIPAMIELERQASNAAHWTGEQYEARIAAEKLAGESLTLVAEEVRISRRGCI